MEDLQKPPIHLIWDDDGSPDGVIALLYFLRHPNISVDAITVSHGQAHTSLFATLLPRMLARLGQAGIPVAAGRASPLAGGNNFPEPWRTPTDTFWGLSLPETGEPLYPRPAPDLIIKVLNKSANPVSLFVTGAHTNLAEALRMAPEIKKSIAALNVMGGAVYVSGNIQSEWPEIHNKVAEWNIWADSVAASEVFNADLPLYLTPLDATDRVTWGWEDVDTWKASGTPEGVLAAEILERMLELSKAESVYLWDLLTAVHMTNPDLCQTERIHVQVITQPGDEEGRTVVVPDQPANTIAYLKPQAAAIRLQVSRVFGAL